MPAASQQQQKIMGLALSVKRGDTPRSEVSDEVLNIVDSMSEKELRKYAGTSHKGLPKKVENVIREMIREIYKEMRESVVSKSVNEETITDTKTLEKIHNDILKFLKSKKGVGEVRNLAEFPNRYGDNVSDYSVRYNVKDKYNYDSLAIKIYYSDSTVFITNKGKFPFKSVNDIKNIINKKTSLKEQSVNEAKKYDIGSGWMGNGLTIWNRAEEQNGDYKIIAHISDNGTLTIRDKQLPNDIKKMFQIWANTMKKGGRPGLY